MTLKKTDHLLDEDELSLNLIEAQYLLRNTRGQSNAKSVLVLVNGIELAGKGEAVKQLREWVDPRYLLVKADAANMFNNTQTYWQPYASFIPAEGQIMVWFGNWYSDLLATALHVAKPLDESQFDAYIADMQAFEQDLKNNHVDVVKVWFDLSWKSLQKRMDNLDPHEVRWHKLHGLDWRNKKQYDNLQKLSQRFTKDWNIIDCEDAKLRNQQFAQIILAALQYCPEHLTEVKTKWQQAAVPELLLHPEKQPTTKEDYKKELKELSVKVAEELRFDNRKAIIVFEGMDAAGKGGAIKRLVKNLDPREYDIHSISAPERYEMRHPYLWRFWTKLQTDEDIRIFDRSWYGRVLVERVEGLVSEHAWQRAYEEINRFEKDLVNSQTVVIKLWLAISKDEQAARFKVREETPNKRFKITPEDWRNREKWDAYLDAAADMFEHTSTAYAPWHIIANDDKNTARLEILRTILKQLRAN
ncbi:phosphate--AMP phosphotransferase [Acinetobacter sp. BSP-28]|uniref:polyphosphate:AMP phosphotransferase n=1 Tax=Acinetobacter sp. BSP-28 TaxID=3344661 RepID=UPI00377070B0